MNICVMCKKEKETDKYSKYPYNLYVESPLCYECSNERTNKILAESRQLKEEQLGLVTLTRFDQFTLGVNLSKPDAKFQEIACVPAHLENEVKEGDTLELIIHTKHEDSWPVWVFNGKQHTGKMEFFVIRKPKELPFEALERLGIDETNLLPK